MEPPVEINRDVEDSPLKPALKKETIRIHECS